MGEESRGKRSNDIRFKLKPDGHFQGIIFFNDRDNLYSQQCLNQKAQRYRYHPRRLTGQEQDFIREEREELADRKIRVVLEKWV